MDKIFYPDNVVVIGASDRADNLGANIIANLLEFDYKGGIYAVGLREGQVHGVPILTSVDALPDGIDLAVILTPAATVPDLLETCGKKGILRAVIESGGFSEFSEEGQELERQVCEVANRWGIRFVGPNCISVVNMENGLCLPFVSFEQRAFKRGPVSVLAQSGGISITYLLMLSEAGLGINKVVSMGNKANLDEVDFLSYLLRDPGTEVIILYLESIEEGRRLIELAATSPKPIIVHKTNVAQASAKIAYSHTGALANDDQIVSTALHQAGIARALDFDDAVTLAQGFALPPVRGKNLVVISRAGGHAVVAADAAEANGFRLMPISEEVLEDVRSTFRADVIALTNPLDLGPIFDFGLYGPIVGKCLSVLDPDAVVVVHTYSTGPEAESSHELARQLGELARTMYRPVAFCPFAPRSEIELLQREMGYPIFIQLEAAMRALAASRERSFHPARLFPLPPPTTRRPHEVEKLLSRDGVLTTDTALGLCAAYGIPVAEWAVVDSVEGALVAASSMEYPVVLKALSPDVIHKSDVGGVVLNVDDPETLRKGFSTLLEHLEARAPGARSGGVLVQRMFPGGREVILGGKRDPSFGPVVMFGSGGIHAEVFEDIVFRLAPLTRDVASEMISEVRGFRLLRGVRGDRPADVEAVVEVLLELSRLMVECPEVDEIDVNPVLVFEEGAMAVDARAVVKCKNT
ncbi:MAG: acetate--CoA ligase family protein [Anaerolineae bacterium]|jgi:acyl-CoA synthetase (NDP forming)